MIRFPALAVLAVLAATALPASLTVADAPDAAASVHVRNFEFHDAATGTPVTTVHAGDVVEWTWAAGVHSVTQGVRDAYDRPLVAGGFDSGIRTTRTDPATGEALVTYRATFSDAGAFPYFCRPHDQMQGIVAVLPAEA